MLYNKTIYDLIEVDGDYFSQNPDAWGDFYTKIKLLPESVVAVLFDEDTSNLLEKMCLGFNLSPEQSASLSRLVRAVLIADFYIGDMPTEITKRLGVDQNTGREIANQIVSLLFADSIEDIKKVQAAKFPDRVAQKRTPPPPTTPQPRQNFSPQNLGGQAKSVPGAELPETGGNIIDLRSK